MVDTVDSVETVVQANIVEQRIISVVETIVESGVYAVIKKTGVIEIGIEIAVAIAVSQSPLELSLQTGVASALPIVTVVPAELAVVPVIVKTIVCI